MDCPYDTLVISGGSLNVISALGALQFLRDISKTDNIKNFIGTSAGSIICYFLIIGYTPIEIIVYMCKNYKMFETLKTVNFVQASRGEGALSFALISDIIEKMTIDKIGKLLLLKDLRELYGKTFVCTTFNLSKNCTEYISDETHPDVPCISAIRMSCNIPVIFEPYKYGDALYVDGGLTNNFPVDIGEKIGNRVLGLNIDTSEPIVFGTINTVEYAYKLLIISLTESVRCRIANKRSTTDIVDIKSGGNTIKPFDFDIATRNKLCLFSIGYECAKNFMNK